MTSQIPENEIFGGTIYKSRFHEAFKMNIIQKFTSKHQQQGSKCVFLLKSMMDDFQGLNEHT